MAEEPDAAESSTDGEDGAATGDADSVGSEVDPEVESQVDPAVDDDAEDAGDTESVDDADGDEAAGADGEDGSADGEDGSDPIGAVTDASSPPEESAPGVADEQSDGDGDGSEQSDGSADGDATEQSDGSADGDATEQADADADGPTDPIGDPEASPDEPMPVDADLEEGEAVDPADVKHGAPPDAVGEGPLQPAEESHSPPEVPDDASEADTPTPAATPAGAAADQPDAVYPDGPPDDQEMPLADHVEEMVLRLAVVAGVATVVAGTVFFFEPLAENMIMFIWNAVIPWESPVPATVGGTAHPVHFVGETAVSTNPRVYGPLELKLAELKFASLIGFVLALPVFVYETYRFMRPGLYPHERRYYLAAVPTSLVLAFVGVSFAYFVILPAIFAYFIRYSRAAGALAFALRSTFDLILVLMGYMALVFQIPLLIMLAIMIGVTDRAWLEDRRLYFWGGFLGVSFLFVPEPTGMAPILVALTMIGLFEGTLALLRWTGN